MLLTGSRTSSARGSSRKVKSIAVQLSMFTHPTFADLFPRISSPGLADGLTPSGSLDGPTTDPSGPVPVPASRSRRRGSKAASPTTDTSGLSSSSSSPSASLMLSLASRLQARTAFSGSTLYSLIWKERATPQGRSISALRASVRRTSASGSGGSDTGWPTPVAQPANGTPEAFQQRKRNAQARGVKMGDTISDIAMVAQLSGWPTPVKEDARSSARHGYMVEGNAGTTMLDAARMAGWSTASARDWKDTTNMATVRPDGRSRLDQLPRQVGLAGWRTPTAQSPNSLRGQGGDPAKRLADGRTLNLTDEVNWLKNNPQPARLTVSGELLTGSSAGMESGGQLNPAHSRWLMGFPPEWDACAPTATRSSRKSRPSSSKP
jgi:hypothetical protein